MERRKLPNLPKGSKGGFEPAAKHRAYVSERISNEVKVTVICFMFVPAILNISISQRVPERHEPGAEYIDHVV